MALLLCLIELMQFEEIDVDCSLALPVNVCVDDVLHQISFDCEELSTVLKSIRILPEFVPSCVIAFVNAWNARLSKQYAKCTLSLVEEEIIAPAVAIIEEACKLMLDGAHVADDLHIVFEYNKPFALWLTASALENSNEERITRTKMENSNEERKTRCEHTSQA